MKVSLPRSIIVHGPRTGLRRVAGQPVGLVIVLVALTLAVGLGLVGLYFALDIHPNVLLRDPNGTAGQPEYYGLISNLGVLGWAVTAAISLHTGLLLRDAGESQVSRILLGAGALTAVLCLDDLFMLHEGMLRRVGVHEAFLLVAYAVTAIYWVKVSLRRLLGTEWLLLFAALCGLGGSVVVDLSNLKLPGQLLIEDMLKFFGILCWSVYFVRLSRQSLR